MTTTKTLPRSGRDALIDAVKANFDEVSVVRTTRHGESVAWNAVFDFCYTVRVKRDPEELYHCFIEHDVEGQHGVYGWSAKLVECDQHADSVDLTYEVG